MSAGAVAAVVFLTGYAPLVRWPGLAGSSLVVSFLLTAALVRWLAVGPLRWDEEFATRARRLTRRHVAAGALALAAAASVVAYGLTHPLWAGAIVASDGADGPPRVWGFDVRVFTSDEPRWGTYRFSLENVSRFDVVVTSVEPLAVPGLELLEAARVRAGPAEGDPEWPFGPARPFRETTISGRSARTFVLDLHFRGCRGAQGRQTFDEVRVRYRVLGGDRSARVYLGPSPAASCG